MKSARFLPLLAGAMLLAGCDDAGDVIIAPPANLAYTRFVHAVSDTGATDWRFIDQLEYSPIGLALTFRTFSPYQATEAGARQLRVFPRSTNINLTQQHLIDATINLEAGRYYTLVHFGLARAGSTPEDQLLVLEDPIPATIANTDVAVRAMHLGAGLANPDVYALATPTTAIGTNSPVFTNIPFGTVTSYLTRATGAFAFQATPTGQTTPVIAAATAPAGSAADANANLTAIGGTGIGGSALIGIYTPGSVVGSSAPQTAAFVVQTGVSMAVTPLGYHRASGTFAGIAGDGWEIGQTVTATGFSNAANNGTSTVSGFTPSRTTGTISLASDATTDTYIRTTGSFVTDGFTTDMWVTVTGFGEAANNGRARVTGVTALTLSVAKDLVTEAAAGSRAAASDLILNVTKVGGLVNESAGSSRTLRGPPRPGWVYIIDKHPR